jgi:diaminohydroxyphosphoribosylaminopyrimidine deaminase/5-amino-6-(5-phosphoribosylamino)uracil reductase
VAKSAQTLDGKIAASTGNSQWITSEAARSYARKVRDEFDAILVGINTVLKDDPSLGWTNRDKRMKKIILDSSLRISVKAKLFKQISANDCIVATTQKASRSKRIALERKGVNYIICPEKDGRVDIKWLFRELGRRGIISVLIEGGAKVIGSALKAGLVDKMHIYIAPKILGDKEAKSSISGMRITRMSKAIELKDMTVEKIGKDLLVKGYVLRHC